MPFESQRCIGKVSGCDAQLVAICYGTFLLGSGVVYILLSEGMSSLLTLSAGLQALGFLLLHLKVQGQTNVSGISVKMLGMYVLTLACRLSTTLIMHGYLPADKTGDWIFQCLEIASFMLASWLLRIVLCQRRTFDGAFQNDQDSMPGLPVVAVLCMVAAWFFHADLNDESFFDVIWAAACYLETTAMLPQLWMMSKAGGEVEALTSHFIALTTLARVLSLWFWYLAFEDGIGLHGNISEMAIIGAHVVQLLLSCDFLILYVKSFGKRVSLDTKSSQWL